jgi:hypothetical protein
LHETGAEIWGRIAIFCSSFMVVPYGHECNETLNGSSAQSTHKDQDKLHVKYGLHYTDTNLNGIAKLTHNVFGRKIKQGKERP